MMNEFQVEEIATQIAYSEDPVAEFAKIAEDLDDQWKATLAREVNKKMFLKSLENSDLNQNIEFDIIDIPQLKKMASAENNTDATIEKTASQQNLTKIAELKKEKIKANMFILGTMEDNFKIVKTASSSKKIDNGINEEKYEMDLMFERKEQKRKEQLTKSAESYQKKNYYYSSLEKIAYSITDPGKLKTVLAAFADSGLEKEAEFIANTSPTPAQRVKEVSFAPLTEDDIEDINKAVEFVKESSLENYTRLIKGILKLTNISGKMAGKAMYNTGRVAFKTLQATGRHPIAATGVVGGMGAALTNANELEQRLYY